MGEQAAVLESLSDRVDQLARELELAIRWDRPSILLAVYSSVYVVSEAVWALETRLREGGQAVEAVEVTGETDADIPLRLADHPHRDKTVFFVIGLQQGGKTALRALNIRREYFVDERLRVVFWLSESEAVAIARDAPDFWAFRHRVVEFVEAPGPGQAAVVTRELAWQGLEDRTLREDTEAKIALRQALLADLPDRDETLAARAELQYTLGGLYGAGRQYERAVGAFSAALEAARRTNDYRLESGCHNGFGNVYFMLGQPEEAVAAYQRAIEVDPQDALPHSGLGSVYRSLGRQEEAVAAYQRAIELDPQYALPHNGLGNVYRSLGRHEEAVAAYRRAIELDPQDALPHYGLGTVYRSLGRQEDAVVAYLRAIELDPSRVVSYVGLAGVYRRLGKAKESARYAELARERLPVDDWYNRACLEAVAGNVEEALQWLTRALVEKPGLRTWAQRDPDFEELRADPRFWEVVGRPSTDPAVGR